MDIYQIARNYYTPHILPQQIAALKNQIKWKAGITGNIDIAVSAPKLCPSLRMQKVIVTYENAMFQGAVNVWEMET